jgi:hypothetical protein
VPTKVVAGHKHEFSQGGVLLQHPVRTARIGERQALGDDRVDLAATKQLEQREVLGLEDGGLEAHDPPLGRLDLAPKLLTGGKPSVDAVYETGSSCSRAFRSASSRPFRESFA